MRFHHPPTLLVAESVVLSRHAVFGRSNSHNIGAIKTPEGLFPPHHDWACRAPQKLAFLVKVNISLFYNYLKKKQSLQDIKV